MPARTPALTTPLTPARILFTYLVPLVPAIVRFDGVVSCLRSYTSDELGCMVEQVPGAAGYHWEIGVEPAIAAPLGITWLCGRSASTVTSIQRVQDRTWRLRHPHARHNADAREYGHSH